MPTAFGLVVLLFTGVIAIASQFKLGRYFLERYLKWIFFSAIVVIFTLNGYLSFKQYEVWLADPLAKFLLPPYQSLNYFVSYAFTHFFMSYSTSLLAALLLLGATIALNKRSGEIFFEKGESYLAALSLFLVGHPGWLIYIIILIAIYLLLHTAYYLLQRERVRLPLYSLWAPVAFFVILFYEWLLPSQLLN